MLNLILLAIIVSLVIMIIRGSLNNKREATSNLATEQQFLAENKAKEGIFQTSSGLQYQILSRSANTKTASSTSKVKVHYHGTLLSGDVFDSSVERDTPIEFSLNQVIKGWQEGLQLMCEGDKFRLFIPSSLAYGNRRVGKIPAGSLLVFDVELLELVN